MNKLQIGMWYSQCCWEDLYEIQTQEDVDLIVSLIRDDKEDDMPISVRLWDTKKQALIDLSNGESEENLARIRELHGET